MLNGYFTGTWLRASPKNTQAAVAYDLKKWLDFVASSRDRPTWRDATTEDRAAFEQWRRKDPRGPRIASTTWDREVATVNGFYQWAVRQGHVPGNPLVQRPSRARRRSVNEPAAQTPAEASHLGPRRDLEWLTPVMYRCWRDVGVRGFTSDGLPDRSFRGRYASRNAAFTDMLIRTSLRISEQVALSLFDLPELTHAMVNARTWLPNAVAKNGSGRAIYIPASVLKDVRDYIETERADAVAAARAAGLYDRIHDPLIVEDRQLDRVRVGRQWVGVAQLDPGERRRLLVRTDHGLEPAALWLTGRGTPATVSAWQQVFKDAKTRCARHAVRIRCHPHALRHSFERRLGLPHATFYRNFADLIQQFQQQTSARRLNRKLTVPVRRRGETPGVEAQCRRPFEGEARSGTIATELLAERRLTPPDLPGVPPKSTSRHAHRRSVQERLLVEPF